MTDAEHALWHHLRNRALMGWKFRRQHPVGPYIVDFACLECGLAVELDGGQHAPAGWDGARTRYIERKGFMVLRFWNNEVFKQQEAVLAVIFDALHSRALTPTPAPRPGPRQRRGRSIARAPVARKPCALTPQAGEGL
ncbi:MAG: endonuclease domain-containing protein [Pseudomonadota bacterium]|nr:endonuclease domain-containing protein [Pseudomonadota bacterium]